MQNEHSTILSTFTKLPFVIRIFVFSILRSRLRQVLLYSWKNVENVDFSSNSADDKHAKLPRMQAVNDAQPDDMQTNMISKLFTTFWISWLASYYLLVIASLTLKAPITTKVVCFSRLLKCLRSLYGKQCGPRSDCSYRSSLFWVHTVCFRILNSSVILGNYLQQTTSADDIFRCIFSWRFKG